MGLLCGLICCPAARAAEFSDGLLGASGDEHLWFVAEAREGEGAALLCYHALSMEGPYVEALMTLPRTPEALATRGDELFLVFSPEPAARRRQREVYSLRVLRHPVRGSYYTEPPDRLDVLAPLPGEGKLAGFVGAARGPVALLVPPQHAGAGVSASEDAAAAEPTLQQPLLQQWRGGRWAAIDLPEEFGSAGPCHLAIGGAEGELLIIVTGSAPTEDTGATLHVRDPSGAWRLWNTPVAAGRIRALTRAGAQVAAVIAGPRDERCQLVYLRPGLILPLAEFARPATPWTVLGLRDGLRIVTCRHLDDAAVQAVDAITGELHDRQDLRKPPVDVASVLRMPVLLAITIFVLVVVIRNRPGARPPVSLPPGHAPVAAMPRLAAVAIDLIPGAAVTMFLLSCRPADLFGLPLMAPTFQASVPYILMISITIVHGTVGELIWRRSPGKAVVGAALLAVDGRPPEAGRILLRNLVKYVILLVPPLAVLALMDPNLQGLDDLVGRTVVVRRKESPAESEDNDR